MIIDANELIIGRLATFVAKQLLLGEEVSIVNSEKAVISGPRKKILNNYKEKRERGHPYAGPFTPTQPHMLLKRTIRGMLPWGQSRGREAYKRIKCYNGVPKEFQGKQFETVAQANVSKLPHYKFMKLSELSEELK